MFEIWPVKGERLGLTPALRRAVCRVAARRPSSDRTTQQTDDAKRLLSEAEAILAKSLEDRPYDWRNWQASDLGRLALDEARQTPHREAGP
jgi:hypothetical protein